MVSVHYLFLVTLLLNYTAHAQLINITEGLNKAQLNLQAAEHNKKETQKYNQSLLNNIKKFEDQATRLERQKKDLLQDQKTNSEQLKKIAEQEKMILKWLAQEEKILNEENKQTLQLQNHLEQLAKNRSSRLHLIENYQQQLSATRQNQLFWQQRENQLKEQQKKVADLLSDTNHESNKWKSQKAQTEKEGKNWNRQASQYQQKYNTLKSLYENQ